VSRCITGKEFEKFRKTFFLIFLEQAGQKWTKNVCVKIFKNTREKERKSPYKNEGKKITKSKNTHGCNVPNLCCHQTSPS
jgi:hypothetical protein